MCASENQWGLSSNVRPVAQFALSGYHWLGEKEGKEVRQSECIKWLKRAGL